MNGELPQGWTRCRIEDVFRSFGGGTPNKGNPAYWDGEIPWLSSGDIKTQRVQSGTKFITKVGLDNSSSNLCRPGSVLVVVRSGILKHSLPIATLEREAAINQDIKCFDSGVDELNCWLAWALRSSAKDILALNREGTTVQSVKYRTLLEFDLPLPPLAELRRVLAKLETLLGKVDACQHRLARIPNLLNRFRQSVLAAACSGRLTADWREQNPNNLDIDAMLASIRRRKEESAQTAAQRAKIHEIFSESEENNSGDLPDGWRFIRLNKLCDSFNYGTSAKSHSSGRVPVLRMGNIQNGEIDWTDLVYTSDREEIQSYSLVPRTVLFNRTNSPELVGKTAIYRGERPAVFAGYLIRINQLPELDPEYLNLCLNTNYAKEFCTRVKSDGVSQSNINAQKLGGFEVPFCELAEQQQIVRRVEALFALAERIEARYREGRTRMDSLAESILAKAVRGELVPTEAELAELEGRSFQSAQELLKRLEIEKEKAPMQEKAKRRPKPDPTAIADGAQLVELIQRAFGNKPFTFEALEGVTQQNYELLREGIFDLLRAGIAGTRPALSMSFETAREEMQFRLETQ